MAIVLDGTSGITNDSGYTGDGVSFADSTPANTLVTTSDGNVGIGTSSPTEKSHIVSDGNVTQLIEAGVNVSAQLKLIETTVDDLKNTGCSFKYDGSTNQGQLWGHDAFSNPSDPDKLMISFPRSGSSISFHTDNSERAHIDSDGNLLVAKTAISGSTVGVQLQENGVVAATVGSATSYVFYANRQENDGVLVSLRQAGTQEGVISVSGTTVSYLGGHLSRWAQTLTHKDESLVKGTVLSNLDEMNVYTDAEGNPVQNEQLNKVKVSDVEGDANVAGVFVNWDHDEDHNVDEINMAMTGDMIIRIAQGVTVARGDLLMSAGDGTAKPQGDDIVRSKTIAKVTSTHVTCTYADGSFCVPCVLMAC